MRAGKRLVDRGLKWVVLDVCVTANSLCRISLTGTENIARILLKSVISYH